MSVSVFSGRTVGGFVPRALPLLLAYIGVLLIAPPLASAQTCKSGLILNQTWTLAQSPICVDGDLDVASLTIEPGVRVEVDGDFEIRINGTISAIGEECAPIVFTSKDPTARWKGIKFQDSPPGSALAHCEISRASNSGIRIFGSVAPPAMSYCTIKDNTTPDSGGGLYLDITVQFDLLLDHCIILNNQSTDHGGGIRAIIPAGSTLKAESCSFENNWANPTEQNGNFVGGAMYASGLGEVVMTDCAIRDNQSRSRCSSSFGCTVTGRGGGLYLSQGLQATLIRCDFVGNRSRALNRGDCFFGGASHGRGAGIYLNEGTLDITNCFFSANVADTSSCGRSNLGTALYVELGDATLTNCTVARNTSGTALHQADGTLSVMNSILYFNNGGGDQYGGTVSFEYCDVQGPVVVAGPGNKNVNPLFAGNGSSRVDLTVVNIPGIVVDAGNPDPAYNDCVVTNPGYGVQIPYPTELNDMGMHGGPEGCGWAPACYADMDKSTGPGVLDIFDFLAFQDAFVAGDPYAINCDMSTGCEVGDVFDFLCFQNAFVAGCP